MISLLTHCTQSYPTGNISKLFGELKLGDSVAVRGPKGNFNYQPNMVRAIGMIAGKKEGGEDIYRG